MKGIRWTNVVLVPLALGALLSSASAQGKGSGKDKGAKKADKGHVEHVAAPKQGKAKKAEKAVASKSKGRGGERVVAIREAGGSVGPRDFRAFSVSKKHGQRLAGLVIARANRGGLGDDVFVITPFGKRTQVKNKAGLLLLDLDDDRDVGTWRVVGERDLDKKGAPSFCRSGEGHPVFGRQWCVDKGFGVGSDGDHRWGRVIQPDVVLRRSVDTPTLDRAVLVDVLGDIVFNRLAAQAITLGLVDPLVGRWLGEPTGPRVLLLSSGNRPVAEIVDVNRDNRAEMLLVALRPR